MVFTDSTSLDREDLSFESTLVIAMQEVVLRRHTLPSLDLFLTMQYGTPIFLQRAGRNITSSMGATSLAMTTSWAFFFSIRVVTVLTPWRTTAARLVGASSLPAALAAARSLSLSFLACFVSGLYLSISLNSWISAPMPKFLLLFSKRGLTTRFASGLLTASGAAATFFPFFPFFATIFLLL